jgi:hypothetical protein
MISWYTYNDTDFRENIYSDLKKVDEWNCPLKIFVL